MIKALKLTAHRPSVTQKMICCAGLLLIAFSCPITAQDDPKLPVKADTTKPNQLTIVTPPFPGLFNENGRGYYDNLFKTIGQKIGYSISVQILPARRVIRQFNKDKSHCLFPSNLIPPSEYHIKSSPFNYAKSYLVSTKSAPPPIDRLIRANDHPYNISLRAGLDYGRLKKLEKANFFKVETETQNIRMLLAGRADFAAVYFPDIMLEAPHFLSVLKYDKTAPLTVIPEEIICWRDSATSQILPKINHHIDVMKKNQAIQKILGAAYLTKD